LGAGWPGLRQKEALTENRQQLEQLSNERCKLIEEARRAAPDNLLA